MSDRYPVESLPAEVQGMTMRAFHDLPYADASLLPDEGELVELHMLGTAESGRPVVVECYLYFGDFGVYRCGEVTLNVLHSAGVQSKSRRLH